MFELVKLPRRGAVYPITIAELKTASRELDRLLVREERDRLVDYLALHPERGELVPGGSGLRKIRWTINNKGKSTGIRIVYYYHDLNVPLLVLAVYSKGEKLRLSKREETQMAQLIREMKIKLHSDREYREDTSKGSA